MRSRRRESAVELRTYFDPPLHTMPGFARHEVAGGLGTTETLAARILSLPMANDLADEARDRIVACLGAATAERALTGSKGSP